MLVENLDNNILLVFSSLFSICFGYLFIKRLRFLSRQGFFSKPVSFYMSSPAVAIMHCLFISSVFLCFMPFLLLAEAATLNGEPVHVFQGISHWPTTLIRIQILIVSICFGIYSYARWKESNDKLFTLSGFRSNDAEKETQGKITLGDKIISTYKLILSNVSDVWKHGMKTKQRELEKLKWSISTWSNDIDKRCAETSSIKRKEGETKKEKKKVKMMEILEEYQELGSWRARITRVSYKAFLLIVVVFTTFKYLTPQPALIRDSYPLANFFFGDVFVFMVISIAVIMIVIGNDVTRLGCTFTKALRKCELEWNEYSPDDFELDDYRNIEVNKKLSLLELIADRTRAITPLVFFPFLIIFLMVLSRSTFFDGWRWSIELVVVYGAISFYVLVSAILLQREASLARKWVLESLNSMETKEAYWDDDAVIRQKNKLYRKSAIDQVQHLNKGAFVSWYKHPIFQALALPTSGTSGVFLLQYLS